MNNRRKLLLVLGASTFTPRALFGQSKQPVLIGWLHADSRESSANYLSVFKEGLAALGWKEGSQIVIEERWADGRGARLQPLAEELAAKKSAVIVTTSSVGVAAIATKAAPGTPIVYIGGDPVAAIAPVLGVMNVLPDRAARFFRQNERLDLFERGLCHGVLAHHGDRCLLATADAGRRDDAHPASQRPLEPGHQLAGAGELAGERIAHAHGERRGRRFAFLDDVKMVVESGDFVDFGLREPHLPRERRDVGGGEVAVVVLDQVQVLDQQVTAARPAL